MNPHSLSPRQSSVAPFLFLAVFLAVCVVGAATGTGQSDQKEEREIKDEIPAHLPVKFKIKNPEKAKDLANEDWLRDIEIEVKNTGTKPIYFLRFSLFFIDVQVHPGKQLGYPLSYGRPELMVIDERAKPEDVPIMPGEVHVFRMPGSYYKNWNLRRKMDNKAHPKKIGLRFYELNFGDGTGFTGTGGDPIPGRRSSVNQRENRAHIAREWSIPHAAYRSETLSSYRRPSRR